LRSPFKLKTVKHNGRRKTKTLTTKSAERGENSQKIFSAPSVNFVDKGFPSSTMKQLTTTGATDTTGATGKRRRLPHATRPPGDVKRSLKADAPVFSQAVYSPPCFFR
jgi:hypothetical protein